MEHASKFIQPRAWLGVPWWNMQLILNGAGGVGCVARRKKGVVGSLGGGFNPFSLNELGNIKGRKNVSKSWPE